MTLHTYTVTPPSNVPTKYQLLTIYVFQDKAHIKFQNSRSLYQGQMLYQGHTMTLHTYTPQPVSLPGILRFPRYCHDKILKGKVTTARSNFTSKFYSPYPEYVHCDLE